MIPEMMPGMIFLLERRARMPPRQILTLPS
jgi:hypothetical protein